MDLQSCFNRDTCIFDLRLPTLGVSSGKRNPKSKDHGDSIHLFQLISPAPRVVLVHMLRGNESGYEATR